MVPGMPNAYEATPLVKMVIAVIDTKTEKEIKSKTFSVLYNPQSYSMSRTTTLKKNVQDGAKSGQQFARCSTYEFLNVDLFLDTFNAGVEVIGLDKKKSAMDALKFAGNCELDSYAKQLDVRDYVNKLYDLCLPDSDSHRPPLLKLVWNSLGFFCFMQSCSVEFVKFKETGMPVRAICHCSFVSAKTLEEMAQENPFNSPDTSKFHRIEQGETLQDISVQAYKDPKYWRVIAEANGIKNPRLIRTGDVIRMPAVQ